MERQEFEDSLKRAFEEAEFTPSENVWVGVELDLEKERTKKLKKRVLYYQLLAAASVMFTIGLSVNTYLVKDSDLGVGTQIAQNTTTGNTQLKANEKTDGVSENESETTQAKKNYSHKQYTEKQSSGDNAPLTSRHSASINQASPADNQSIAAVTEESYATIFGHTHERALPPLVRDLNPRIPMEAKKQEQVDPVVLMMAKLEQREKEILNDADEKENERNRDEKMWTSVGFAAGSFTAVNAGVDASPANAAIAMNTPQVNEEVKASGMSYSMGINLGTKLSERWVIQGGVNYLTQSSEYTAYNAVRTTSPITNFTSFKPPSVSEVQHLHDSETQLKNEKLVATAPYNVNNSLRYLTIPLQAGYMVVNRDFGVQVNAGVASDLFLQNTVSAEGDNIDKSTQMPGSDTPYRQFNFSGLVGTEFSYRFGDRYRISLNPGIRYPFNSIYKSDLDVKASPLTLDVGLRFRYIFH